MEQRSDFKLLTLELMDELSEKARRLPRKRLNYNFHELNDVVQRFLNAIEPGSYVRPHRHVDPPKMEFFVVLRGKFLAILFDDAGSIKQKIHLDAIQSPGIQIQPGTWHTVISLEKGGVFFEVKEGPYHPIRDKDFAPWSPLEGTPEAQTVLNSWIEG